MEAARDEVVRILNERGSCSVAELADAIGVSQGAVRRHLDIMRSEGLVDSELARQPRGRPVSHYRLSEAGEERSSAVHYARLLDHLYPALAELSADEVSGRSGDEILQRTFAKVAEAVATEASPLVRGEDLDTRVSEVVHALEEVGILNEVAEEADAYRLRNVGCPCRSTAQATSAPCEADRYSIELLLGTPVRQVATIAGGAGHCEYVVDKLQHGDGPLLATPTARREIG